MSQSTESPYDAAGTPEPPAPTIERDPKQARKAATGAFLGTVVEMYDFLLYASAAGLVFPAVFFSELDPALAATLGFVSLLAGYISRPIGGLLFGHFGDVVGRKRMLLLSMLIMGGVSICIGLLPGEATLGAAAAVILTTLRVIQGIAIGGEYAGATLMAMEHSKEKAHGWTASLAAAGGPAGSVLATFVLGLFAFLPDEQFLAWGWRIPFLLSTVIVIIALYIRASVHESPEFVAAQEKKAARTQIPIFAAFRKAPLAMLLGPLVAGSTLFVQGLLVSFMVPYVVAQGTVERETALMMVTISSVFHIFTIPGFAWLSDRLGRRRVMLGAVIFCVLAVWPMMLMFDSGSPLLVALAFVVGNPLIQASIYGPLGAFLAERFEPAARYTGVSFTYQFGAIIGAGIAPLLAQFIVYEPTEAQSALGLGTGGLAGFMAIYFVVAGICIVALTRVRATR